MSDPYCVKNNIDYIVTKDLDICRAKELELVHWDPYWKKHIMEEFFTDTPAYTFKNLVINNA